MKYIECPTEYICAGTDTTLFLAGGISGTPDWQKEIIAKLDKTDLTLLNPRRTNFDISNSNMALGQIEWEYRHLCRADAILFWFPCETLCPIVLYELGSWSFKPKKLFIGCHVDYKRKFDVETQINLVRGRQTIVYSLDDLATQVVEWEKRKKINSFVRDPEQPHAICPGCEGKQQ